MSTGADRKPAAKKKPLGLTPRSLVLAVAVHAVIAVLLLVSFNFNTDQPAFSAAKPKAEPIQATAVSDADFREQMQAIEERENRKKQERLEAERKVAELREKQKQEQEKLARIKEEQERLKKKEAEEKRAAELAAKKKEEERRKAELARKKKEEERRKAELAKKKKEEERKKAELAAKKKREEEERLKQLALQRQLEAERRARAVASALNQYIPIITQKVSRNWNRPSNLRSGITAGVAVKLTPSGEVVSAELIRSSGNPVFDRSVVNAVLKASPLPIPRERGVNEEFRNLNLTFNPEDLI